MKDFLVIAHRGACGYLPEHTLEGAALAHGMGADYIELDAVLTRDNALVVLHDLFLDEVTDVHKKFPGRDRADSRHYAIDFTLEELRSLQVNERTREPAFPGRFRPEDNIFRIPSFDEMITLIQGLNRSTGRTAGIYIEPKAPAWHTSESRNIVAEVIQALNRHGYSTGNDPVYLQSFDMAALKQARRELVTEIPLVQLIGENSWQESDTDFDFLQTREGLKEISSFAAGIGPWLPQIIDIRENRPSDISDLIINSHAAGLFVHAYTLRADQLPDKIPDIRAAVDILFRQAKLDGVFTDHPDQVLASISAVKDSS